MSTCKTTNYPTPAPTQTPTLTDPNAFSSGSIIATLPAQFNSSNMTSCFDIPNSNYLNWQKDPNIPADEWFGCQFLSQPIVRARMLEGAMPGGNLPLSDYPTFTKDGLTKMIQDGCYIISVLPQSRTSSKVRHWSSASEFTKAASSSWSQQLVHQKAKGFSFLGSATSSSYQGTADRGTAADRSNSNVGATISRKIHIASIGRFH